MGDKMTDGGRALLGAMWINPKFTLRYRMQKNVPSPEARDALKNLVELGILIKVEYPEGATVYSLSANGKAMNRVPKDGTNFIKKHGSFSLSVKKPRP